MKRFLLALCLGSAAVAQAYAQTKLDLTSASPSASSGTGWITVNNSSAGKSFIDYQTLNKINTSTPAYLNLVGGTYSGSGAPSSSALYTANPMLQIQTGYIGGATSADLGVAFRVRLGGYDATQSFSVLVGGYYATLTSSDSASFAVAATLTSDGTTFTGWALNLLYQTGSSTINKATNFDTGSSGFDASVAVRSGSFGTGLTHSDYVAIQATGDNVFNAGGSDSSDAWLSFGVKFSDINISATATARNNLTLDATSNKWAFTAVPATGTTPSGFNGEDAVGSGGNIYMSDQIYTNGSTVAGANPTISAVPEASTWVMAPVLCAPAVGFLWRRRRSAGHR